MARTYQRVPRSQSGRFRRPTRSSITGGGRRRIHMALAAGSEE